MIDWLDLIAITTMVGCGAFIIHDGCDWYNRREQEDRLAAQRDAIRAKHNAAIRENRDARERWEAARR